MKIHVSAFAMALSLCLSGAAFGDALDQLREIWTKRSEAVHRIAIVAEGETVDAKGVYSAMAKASGFELPAELQGLDVPSSDYSFAERIAYRLDFDAPKARKDKTGQEFAYPIGRHYPRCLSQLHDGVTCQTF